MSVYWKFIDTVKLDKIIASGDFPFPRRLFWETDINTIDLTFHRRVIIERVLTRGVLSDYYVLLKIYSKDEIAEAIKKIRTFDPVTRNFCSNNFNVPIEEIHASSYYD